jgi:hypothetical protein
MFNFMKIKNKTQQKNFKTIRGPYALYLHPTFGQNGTIAENPLKVLSDENQDGSKVVSIASSFSTV